MNKQTINKAIDKQANKLCNLIGKPTMYFISAVIIIALVSQVFANDTDKNLKKINSLKEYQKILSTESDNLRKEKIILQTNSLPIQKKINDIDNKLNYNSNEWNNINKTIEELGKLMGVK
jgi:septal ring factor EnvC (AmiA/AmiB activator)